MGTESKVLDAFCDAKASQMRSWNSMGREVKRGMCRAWYAVQNIIVEASRILWGWGEEVPCGRPA